jgi:hypothetical protein
MMTSAAASQRARSRSAAHAARAAAIKQLALGAPPSPRHCARVASYSARSSASRPAGPSARTAVSARSMCSTRGSGSAAAGEAVIAIAARSAVHVAANAANVERRRGMFIAGLAARGSAGGTLR